MLTDDEDFAKEEEEEDDFEDDESQEDVEEEDMGVLASMIQGIVGVISKHYPNADSKKMRSYCYDCTQEALKLELELATERRKRWDHEKEMKSLQERIQVSLKRTLVLKKKCDNLQGENEMLKGKLKKNKRTQPPSKSQSRTTSSQSLHRPLNVSWEKRELDYLPDTFPPSPSRSHNPVELGASRRMKKRDAAKSASLESTIKNQQEEITRLRMTVNSLRGTVGTQAKLRERVRELEQQIKVMTDSLLAQTHKQQRARQERMWNELERQLDETNTRRIPPSKRRFSKRNSKSSSSRQSTSSLSKRSTNTSKLPSVTA
eukprot:m.14037 g.14037  ORF g.14037 m.14037 type:complete len:317 (-) comp7683_c0_seq6:244-1194(-)